MSFSQTVICDSQKGQGRIAWNWKCCGLFVRHYHCWCCWCCCPSPPKQEKRFSHMDGRADQRPCLSKRKKKRFKASMDGAIVNCRLDPSAASMVTASLSAVIRTPSGQQLRKGLNNLLQYDSISMSADAVKKSSHNVHPRCLASPSDLLGISGKGSGK